ncbi:MAG TPA: phosphopantetheine-binding protein [Actinocrinis sp.]|nr:phosphopantetheine-binding protein [Actinocrinis sp.]
MTPTDIAVLICKIVGIDGIGGGDDFFQAGGTSWGALALMARLEERSGVKLSLLDVFHARTPDRIAALIADRSAAQGVSETSNCADVG